MINNEFFSLANRPLTFHFGIFYPKEYSEKIQAILIYYVKMNCIEIFFEDFFSTFEIHVQAT